jgi:hypothetical protein
MLVPGMCGSEASGFFWGSQTLRTLNIEHPMPNGGLAISSYRRVPLGWAIRPKNGKWQIAEGEEAYMVKW